MLDRASTFADPEIIGLLQTQFIPVGIDQFKQRRQQDKEGDFWRKIAGKGPRSDFNNTTQGLYIATPGGTFLAFNNNRGPERIKKLMLESLDAYDKLRDEETSPLTVKKPDNRFLHKAPGGIRIVRVHAKVLGGYKPTDDKWQKIFQQSVSRDNLWITPREEKVLSETRSFPSSLIRRLALYHLIDNTRGEPSFWKEADIMKSTLSIDASGNLHGNIHLQRGDGTSSYQAELRGIISFNNSSLTRFDLVAHGGYIGGGKYTLTPPEGTFPLGISFRLVDGSSPFDQIPPQGAKSWWQNYLGPQ